MPGHPLPPTGQRGPHHAMLWDSSYRKCPLGNDSPLSTAGIPIGLAVPTLQTPSRPLAPQPRVRPRHPPCQSVSLPLPTSSSAFLEKKHASNHAPRCQRWGILSYIPHHSPTPPRPACSSSTGPGVSDHSSPPSLTPVLAGGFQMNDSEVLKVGARICLHLWD